MGTFKNQSKGFHRCLCSRDGAAWSEGAAHSPLKLPWVPVSPERLGTSQGEEHLQEVNQKQSPSSNEKEWVRATSTFGSDLLQR